MEYPDTEIAVRRAEIVCELQSRIMDEYNARRMDTTMEVLCEGYDPEREQYFGRTYADSPDIDGRVFFDSEATVKVGSFVTVHITDVCDGDLCGYAEEE
jgi:ribosomal protein S12 methylthiotransferase